MIYKVTTSTAPYSICVDGLGPQITTGQVRSIAMSMLDCEIVDVEFSHIHRGVPVFYVKYDHEGEGMGVAEFWFEPLQVEDISTFPCQQRVEEVATPQDRLEYLRTELRNERISTAELIELQSLVEYIDPSDVELLEAAGVPEFGEDEEVVYEDTEGTEWTRQMITEELKGEVDDEDLETFVDRVTSLAENPGYHPSTYLAELLSDEDEDVPDLREKEPISEPRATHLIELFDSENISVGLYSTDRDSASNFQADFDAAFEACADSDNVHDAVDEYVATHFDLHRTFAESISTWAI